MESKPQKPIIWIGTSLRDPRKFPNEVRREIGHALHMEEIGERSHKAKMLRGFSGIIEIVNDYATNTYRAVYAIKIDDNIYVLHVFQKKSKRGIATTKHDLEIVKKRLQQAKQMAKENMSEKAEYTVGSGNAFKDLGFDRPEEELAKSDLAIQINKIIEQMGWTQKKAATVLGIDQPKISALKNGRLGGFSLERLLSFLRALDHDIDIVVRPKTEDVAHIQVAESINRPKYVTR